jgi:polysaccharide export outer membrane protein
LSALRQQLSDLEADRASVQSARDELARQIETLQGQLTAANEKAETAEKALTEKASALESGSSELSALRQQLSDLEADRASVQSARDELARQIEELGIQLAEERIAREAAEKLRDEVERAETELAAALVDRDDAAEQNILILAKISALEEEKTLLAKKAEEAIVALANYKGSEDEALMGMAELRMQIEEKQKVIASNSQAMVELESRLNEALAVRETIGSDQIELQALEAERVNWNREREQLNRQMSELHVQQELNAAEVRRVTKALAAAENKVKELPGQIEALKQQVHEKSRLLELAETKVVTYEREAEAERTKQEASVSRQQKQDDPPAAASAISPPPVENPVLVATIEATNANLDKTTSSRKGFLGLFGGKETAPALEVPLATPDTENENLILQAGDQIDLQVFREPEFSGVFLITPEGIIRHPLAGALSLGGKSLKEAETLISERLSEDLLVDPKVILTVARAETSQFVVLGEVKKPGVYPMPVGGVTILQAIALAGGFTELASPDRVRIVRRGPRGEQENIRVKVGELLAGKGRQKDMPLQENDVIMVPEIIF